MKNPNRFTRVTPLAMALALSLASTGAFAQATDPVTPDGGVQIGDGAAASQNCVAIGQNAEAGIFAGVPTTEGECVAIGAGARVEQARGVAIGSGAWTYWEGGTAIGTGAVAGQGVALGRNASASIINAVAIGVGSVSTGGIAIGENARTDFLYAGGPDLLYKQSIAIGGNSFSTVAGGGFSSPSQTVFSGATLVGDSSQLRGPSSVLIGSESFVRGTQNTVVGANTRVEGTQTTLLGADSQTAIGERGQTGLGYGVVTSGEGATVVGAEGSSVAYATAVGHGANARNERCVALGADSECVDRDEVSVGNATETRRVSNLSNGFYDTDAVNVRQLRGAADAIGGGAGIVNGQFIAPTINLSSGNTHNNTTDAILELDGRLRTVENNPGGGGQGPAGASAYQVAVNNGFTGNEQQWLDSLQGAAGAAGANGSSAYQVAVGNGFVGTETQWLESLRGEKGDQGDPGVAGNPGADGVGIPGTPGADGSNGSSAYEIALREGFVGTESEWLESLRGADGQDGVGGGGNRELAAGRNVEVVTNEDGTQTAHVSDSVLLSEQGSVQVGRATLNGQGVAIQNGASITTAGVNAGGQRVTQVAAGRIEAGSTDAINGGQIWALQQQMDDRWTDVNRRVDRLDRRVSSVCAMGQANAQMASSTASIKTRNRLAMGGGYCGGETALSIGYARDVTTPNGSPSAYSVGVSRSGSDTAVGVAWAIGW